MSYTLNTPRYEKGNLSFGGHASVDSELIVSQNRSTFSWGTVKEGTNVDQKVGGSVGVNADYTFNDGKTVVDTDLTLSTYVNHKNEQEGPDSGFMLVPEQVTWTTGITHEVTPDMKVIGESAIVMRNVGTTGIFKAGVFDTDKNYGLNATYQKPFTDDMPAFDPLSSEAVGVGVYKKWERPNKRVGAQFELGFQRDLDFNRNQAYVGFGLKF